VAESDSPQGVSPRSAHRFVDSVWTVYGRRVVSALTPLASAARGGADGQKYSNAEWAYAEWAYADGVSSPEWLTDADSKRAEPNVGTLL